MKKCFTITILSALLLGSMPLTAQKYNGNGFANGVPGEKYSMPGAIITSESDVELNTTGVISGYWFDIASLSGADLNSDKNVSYGIFEGSGTDGGGMDKRGYSTNSSTAYTPIRWNGGSQMFRSSGQWVRFTIDFAKGVYNFVYRGNIAGFAVGSHKFDLKIYSPNNISVPLYTNVVDLTSGIPVEGNLNNNILRIGGGNDDTDWFKVLDPIQLEAGTYVVELATGYNPFSYQPWGCFTFNEAEVYKGVAYISNAWIAGKDTIDAWKYDKVGYGTTLTADKDISFGTYSTEVVTEGLNIRGYTENPLCGSIRWNETTQTFQTNGGWYNYSTFFEGNQSYFFAFRGVPLANDPVWGATLKILEPNTKSEISSISFNDGVEFISSLDEGEATRWMYIKKPLMVEQGTYLVQLDFPNVGTTGLLGEFTFTKEHPASNVAQVIAYNWPATIPKSDKYSVRITQAGVENELFTHLTTPDLRPSLEGDNGVPNFMVDRSLSFCQFAFTDEILVEVTKEFGGPAHRVEIQPKAYGINPLYFDGKTVRFYVRHQADKPTYLSVNFISDDNLDEQGYNHIVPLHGMMLFGDRLEVHVPNKNAVGTVVYNQAVSAEEIQAADVIYFPAGDYDLKEKFVDGKIELTKDGQHVYVEGGAYVRGTIYAEGHDNVWLYGRGIFTGADYVFHELRDDEGKKEAYMNFIGADNCHFEGIAITDPCHHTIPSGSNSYFKNMKIMGWSYNADGTRVGGGAHIEGMFYRTMDDRDYGDRKHTFKNSVLWPMRNGAFSILGWQSYDGGKATYENLYFINSEWDRPERTVGNQGVIGSKNKQGSNIANDTIRNIYLEDYTTILTVLRHEYDPTLELDPNDPGEFKNFLFENIKVEHPFIKSTGEQAYQRIEGFNQNGIKSSVHDITFRNLVVAGELVTKNNKDKYFLINEDNAYNIFFEIVGDVHTIRTNSGVGGNIYPGGDLAVPNGTSQYVSIQPLEGYRIKDVKIDYKSVGRIQTIHIDNVTSDHVIEVEFEEGDNVFDLTNNIEIKDFLSDNIDLGVEWDTSIRDIFRKKRSELNVYPNPASKILYVKGVDDDEIINVYNLAGCLVLTSMDSNINIAGLDKGIYIISVKDRFAKVIVE